MYFIRLFKKFWEFSLNHYNSTKWNYFMQVLYIILKLFLWRIYKSKKKFQNFFDYWIIWNGTKSFYTRMCALWIRRGLFSAECSRKNQNLYGTDALGESKCGKLFMRFWYGDRILQDLTRQGWPKIINLSSLKDAVDQDPFLTTPELQEMFDCSLGTISNAFEEICKVKSWEDWLHMNYQRITHFKGWWLVLFCSLWLKKARFGTWLSQVMKSRSRSNHAIILVVEVNVWIEVKL